MYIVLITTLFSSCIAIQFGSDPLTQQELKRFVPFAERGELQNFTQADTLVVYVINPKQLQAIIHENELVWIHKWRPFCSADRCQIISPFAKKAQDNNVALSFISETLDLKNIDAIVTRAQYPYPIYYGWPEHYGTRIGKARKLMKEDLLKNQNTKMIKFADDYLYKNGKLIFQGDGLIDSIENVLIRN